MNKQDTPVQSVMRIWEKSLSALAAVLTQNEDMMKMSVESILGRS
jgi:hypothetical protein